MAPGGTTGIDGEVRPVKRSLLRPGIAFLLATFAPPALHAQTTSAALVGTVSSQQGVPVPDALVRAHSDSSGVLRTAVTDAHGHYRIDLLSPGAWTAVVRLSNGQMSESRAIRLRLQETLTLDFSVGSSLTEKVTVVASALVVDPSRTGSELRIDASQAGDLPVNGRVLTDLALLDSAIRPEPPSSRLFLNPDKGGSRR